MAVDSTAVLAADIIALAHPLGRIMRLPEDLQKLIVTDNLRVEDDPHRLRMPRQPAAHLFVGRVGGVTALIADRCHPDPGLAPEEALGSPEAPECEVSHLQMLRIGRYDRTPIVVMRPGGWQSLCLTGQSFRRRRQAHYSMPKEHGVFLLQGPFFIWRLLCLLLRRQPHESRGRQTVARQRETDRY